MVANPTMNATNRRRQQHTRNNKKWMFFLRRSFSASETVYAFLCICVVVFLYIVITLFDASSPLSPFLSPSNLKQIELASFSSSALFHSKFSATGSAKQLQHLVQNITLHAHKQLSLNAKSNHVIPSTLIVAIAVNYAYRKLALNFVCNLNRLNISNYIVFAMDKPVYDYLSQRDTHVFYHDLSYGLVKSSSLASTSSLSSSSKSRRHRKLQSIERGGSQEQLTGNDTSHQFGTTEFIETSRRKSMLVLRLLTMGYSVLFSDVDVVWVRNPIPSLLNHTGHFVIQSDSNTTQLNYNINSGFYLARTAPQTIIAMRAIIKYSYAIRRSEQKAFNHVLCGAFKMHHGGPGKRLGISQCQYTRASTITEVLPLDQFPNGSNQSLWIKSNQFTNSFPNVVAIHANYIQHREEKENRIRDIGFWFHSESSESRDECVASPALSNSMR